MLDLEPFEKLDRVIHERGRLAIMSLLATTERLTFTELRETLGLTDGNLSVHLRKLEAHGYLVVDKQFVDRKPRSEYALTPEGRAAFADYIQALEVIVRQAQPDGEQASTLPAGGRLKPGLAGSG